MSDSSSEWKKVLISTGIKELNELLVRDLNRDDFFVEDGQEIKEWQRGSGILGGFVYLIENVNTRSKWKTPVILIEGPSASGKTLLSLQVSLGMAEKAHRKCIFYCLEKDPEILLNTVFSFRKFGYTAEVSLPDGAEYRAVERNEPGVYFFRLSPRPLQTTRDPLDFLEERFQQLESAIVKLTAGKRDPLKHRAFFFVDSLSVFGRDALSRDLLLRLFNLFKRYCVPVVFTLERQEELYSEDERTQFQVAKYLADVVIRLHVEEKDYFTQFIEVSNTSFCRHVLGRHLIKIWTPVSESPKVDTKEEVRKSTIEQFRISHNGFTIFPSLHYLITRARGEKDSLASESVMFHMPPLMKVFPIGERIPVTAFPGGKRTCREEKELIGEQVKREEETTVAYDTDITHAIPQDSLVVLSGLMGCHKFALAANLFLASLVRPLFKLEVGKNRYDPHSCTGEENPLGLIVSFSVEEEIKLNEIAQYTQNPEVNKRYRRLNMKRTAQRSKVGTKAFLSEYVVEKEGNESEISKIIVANFRLGSLMPEEVVYYVQEWLKHTSSVLFVDTALVRSGFPFLHRSPIFYTSLVDILKEEKLFSVFVDVCGTADNPVEPTYSLLAEADFRIFLKPFKAPEGKGARPGCVQFHVENVRGKGYDIEPKYLWIEGEEDPQGKRVLRLGLDPYYRRR